MIEHLFLIVCLLKEIPTIKPIIAARAVGSQPSVIIDGNNEIELKSGTNKRNTRN